MSQFVTDSHIINTVPVLSPDGAPTKAEKKPSNRIRLRDSRDLYLLIGECRALGGDGIAWRQLLAKRLHSLLDADFVSFVDCRIIADPSVNADWLQTLSTIDYSSADSCQDSPLDPLLHGLCQPGMLSQAIHNCQGAVVAPSNETLLGVDWCKEIQRQGNGYLVEVGQTIIGVNRCAGEKMQFLQVFRRPRQPLLSRRAVYLLRALWIELRRFQPEELRTVESSVFMIYPKRMLQVLSCLLAGSTAKETATLLSISVHTVQEHIKRLYKRTSTSNRAELADFFREVAPRLLEMPLDQFPEH